MSKSKKATASSPLDVWEKSKKKTVKKAAHALKAINELAVLINDVSAPDSAFDFFYHDYIKNGAKYKDGLNAIVGGNANNIVTKADRQW